MLEIDICICTFRRAHIRDTLQSLAAMTCPPGFTIRIIVADNDDTPSAQYIVQDTTKQLCLILDYIHAPARNISIARNACLDAAIAPLVAFIDDDELATPDWLTALLAALQTTGADVALGPVQAVYGDDCPAWIRAGNFHSTLPVWIDDEIRTGYTSNVLFRRTAPAFDGLRFRPELGRSGGEDTAFFSTAFAAGARLAYAPDAIVTEVVQPERATFRWLAKRRFRAGQTHGLLMQEKSDANHIKNLAMALAKATTCFVFALFCILRPAWMKYWILRGILHSGVIAQLLGGRPIEQYGIR